MEKYLEGTSCTTYSLTHMKNKLKAHFGEHIAITQINGKSNIVTFRIAADRIMHSFYEQGKTDNTESESQCIVVTAAKLIRNVIKCVEVDNEPYPTQNQLETTEEALKFVPSLLVSFLQVLMTGKDTDLNPLPPSEGEISLPHSRAIFSKLKNEDKDFFSFRNCKKLCKKAQNAIISISFPCYVNWQPPENQQCIGERASREVAKRWFGSPQAVVYE